MMIMQDRLESYAKLKREHDSLTERLNEERDRLIYDIKHESKEVEKGYYSLILKEYPTRIINYGKIEKAFGEQLADKIREGVEPSWCQRLVLKAG